MEANQSLENLIDAEWWSLEGVTVKCKVIDVYDGDTITVIFPFHGVYYKDKLRLFGINTPEIRTRDLEEKKAGKESKKILSDWILNKCITVEFKHKEKYGRQLGCIYNCDCTDLQYSNSINQQMCDQGFALPYDGSGKKQWKKTPDKATHLH